MRVELREVPPDDGDGDHAIVDARGRILVLRLPDRASPEDYRLAAADMQSQLAHGDIGFVLPPGYRLEVYRVVADDVGPASTDTTTPTPSSETAAKPNTTP